MITVYYSSADTSISNWSARLDELFMPYELTEQSADRAPRLVDGEVQAEGAAAIEQHLDKLAQFVAGWYEDRCDRYDYNADETP